MVREAELSGASGTMWGASATTRRWALPTGSWSMARMTFDRRRALAAAAGLLLGLFGVLLAAAPASAHAALVASDPGNGTIVPDAPNKVTLTFTESVQLVTGKVQVLGPDGSRADQAEPTVDGGTLTIPLRAGGGRGTYLVSYRVISADSH